MLRPKLPFLNWISKVEPSIELTLEELRCEQDALMLNISEFESIQGVREWAYQHWEMLFDKSLFDWYTDERYWPQVRNLMLLKDWFDVEWHPVVGIFLTGRCRKFSLTSSRYLVRILLAVFCC